MQLFGATMGTFAGAFEHHHVPWKQWYPNWFAMCTSLRNQGTARQYRLLQGKPKSAATSFADTNVICPSSSTIHRLHEALDWTDGAKQQYIDIYRELMLHMRGQMSSHRNTQNTPLVQHTVTLSRILAITGSDVELMRVRKHGCVNNLSWLAFDSQMLAQCVWISGQLLMGVRPPLTAAQCEAIYSKEASARNKAVKDLNFVNGVEVFMAISAGSGCNMDIGLFWTGQNDSKAAGGCAERVTDMVKAFERCSACVKAGVACECFCGDCERKQRRCNDCLAKGFSEWSHLSRKCARCHESNIDCFRSTVLGVIADQEPKNVSTFNALRKSVYGPGKRLLAFIHDFYHQFRGQRNAAGGRRLRASPEGCSPPGRRAPAPAVTSTSVPRLRPSVTGLSSILSSGPRTATSMPCSRNINALVGMRTTVSGLPGSSKSTWA